MAVVSLDQRQQLLQDATAGTPVPLWLANAVVQQESGWDTAAPNGGLAQITKGTAANPSFGMQPADPAIWTDPKANLKFGMQYLAARGQAAGLQPSDWNDPSKVGPALQGYNGGGDPDYVNHVLRHVGINSSPNGGGAPQSPFSYVDPNNPLVRMRMALGASVGGGVPPAPAATEPASAANPLANPLVGVGLGLQGLAKGYKATQVDYNPYALSPKLDPTPVQYGQVDGLGGLPQGEIAAPRQFAKRAGNAT